MAVPSLRTPRLVLRPWRTDDAAFHRELWAERDPRVPAHRRLDEQGRPTIADLEDAIRSASSDGPVRLFVVERADAPGPIGYCGLIRNEEFPRDEPEIAYEFLVRHHGNGYATEAAGAIVEQARQAGFRRLWATVRAWNAPSLRVLRRLGFVESGRVLHDAAHGDSVYLTLVL